MEKDGDTEQASTLLTSPRNREPVVAEQAQTGHKGMFVEL